MLQSSARFVPAPLAGRPSSSLIPRHNPQYPTYQGVATPDDPYWFQVGSAADDSTKNFTGANITIRTAYDRIILADHSYWVGSFVSNRAFIQVGYLTTISTDKKPYCCAWFYEYFPPGAANPPVIGPPGSAGPIGSWHTYSMLSLGNGSWNFYMDGEQLSNPPLYVGATDSGDHVAYPTAEVAGGDDNKEILGPAEFRNFQVRLADGWRAVPSAKALIFYAANTSPNYFTPTNPYGVWEVEGVDNDFLAGSYIPQPCPPVPLGQPCRPVQPMAGATLWPVKSAQYQKVNFSFVDKEYRPFTPTWIALRDGGNWSLYTEYQNQRILPAPHSGKWTLDWAAWHTVNVAPEGVQLSIPQTTSLTVQGKVFSPDIQVLGSLDSLPINGATVQATFPDSLTTTQQTDSSGHTILHLAPAANYTFQIAVPNGFPTALSATIFGPGEITIRVFGTGELFMVILPPIAGLGIILQTARRGTRRKTSESRGPSAIANAPKGTSPPT